MNQEEMRRKAEELALKIHKNRYYIILGLIMGLFLFWGLSVFRDYGISWDEEIQRNRYLAGLRTAITIFAGQDKVPEALNKEEITSLGVGRLGIKLPLALIEAAKGFSMTNEKVFKIHHLYYFLIFWVSAFFAWYLLRLLGFDQALSSLGLLLYILCPRILADSFYNPKDLILLSLYTMEMCLSVALVKKFRYKTAIALAFICALITTLRNALVFCAVIFAAWYAYNAFITKDKKKIIKTLKELGITIGSSFIFMYILTPGMWVNLSGSISKKIASVNPTFSHGGFDLVAGQLLNRTDLPWYYLPLTMTLTIPCVYIIFNLIGVWGFTKYIAKNLAYCIRFRTRIDHKLNENDRILLIILLQGAFWMFYTFVFRPMQYNLWRHFYFYFIYMVVFAICGLRVAFTSGDAAKYSAIAFTTISLLLTMSWIKLNHPYEYLYFNPLFLSKAARETVQDYWAVSYKGLLSQIKDGSSADTHIYPDLTGDLLFGEPGWENYHLEKLEHTAKYRILEGNPGDNNFYKIFKTVEVDDRICESLVKRENYTNLIRKYYYENGEFSGDNTEHSVYKSEATLTCGTDGTDKWIKIELPDDITVNEIDFLYADTFGINDSGKYVMTTEKDEVINDERLYVSEDDENYRSLPDKDLLKESDLLGINCGEKPLGKYILYKYENRMESGEPAFAIRLFGEDKNTPEKGEVFFNSDDTKTALSQIQYPELFDDKDLTFKTFGESSGEKAVTIELKDDANAIRGLHLDCGINFMRTGRSILIEGSKDGSNFEPLSWYYQAADDYLFSVPASYRFYRISQTDNAHDGFSLSGLYLIR